MRPALQRLVRRPAARELLSFLVRNSHAALSYAPAKREKKCHRRGLCGGEYFPRRAGRKSYAGAALAARNEGSWEEKTGSGQAPLRQPQHGETLDGIDRSQEPEERRTPEASTQGPSPQRANTTTRSNHKHRAEPLPESGIYITSDVKATTQKKGSRASAASSQGNDQKPWSSAALLEAISMPPSPGVLPSKARARPKIAVGMARPKWEETMWTHEQLEFETDLDQCRLPDGKQRLLDSAEYSQDFDLWALFLGYRKRIHGSQGVRSFWNRIHERGILIPTSGHLADVFWAIFIDLGVEDTRVLSQVLDHADMILQKEGRRWKKLYLRVIQQLLTSDHASLTPEWHARLLINHSPGAKTFSEMCRQVVFKSGNLGVLRQIYKQSPYRNVYGKIVPTLCDQENFVDAADWHYYLVKLGDLPSEARIAFPLIQHFDKYSPVTASRINDSLVDAGVPFADAMEAGRKTISREKMNLIHGETHNISVKQYNDKLGARWFATEWISLDVAINGVTALGVQAIGPLSLQAMALREPDIKRIHARIQQLEAGGVSIGTSLYSRAIESFARKGKYDLLAGLLHSDQHPEELENYRLQESLLIKYAEAGDWAQYRLTMEIKLLSSTSPEIDKQNIELRVIASLGNISAALHGVEDMIINKGIFKTQTIACLVRCVLAPRRKGRRPVTRKRVSGFTDLDVCITMLQSIVRSGSYVPPGIWHEVLRRLGMLGRLQELTSLCLWLATLYRGDRWPAHSSYRIPRQVSTSNLQHPLRILFTPGLQRAIVEWGFITNLQHQNLHLSPSTQRKLVNGHDDMRKLTSGIFLLRKLNNIGVYIDNRAIRKSILSRLITYYGPGHSNKRYNSALRHRLPPLEDVAKEIDEALGRNYLTDVALDKLVQAKALGRLRKVARRRARGLGKPSRDPRIEWLRTDPSLLAEGTQEKDFGEGIAYF